MRSPLQALCQAHSLPSKLLQQILRPQSAKRDAQPASLAASTLPAALAAAVESRFNASQQTAVASCCSSHGQFTLVQVFLLTFPSSNFAWQKLSLLCRSALATSLSPFSGHTGLTMSPASDHSHNWHLHTVQSSPCSIVWKLNTQTSLA